MRTYLHALLFFVVVIANSCARKIHLQNNRSEITLRIMSYNIHHCNPPSKQKEGVIDIDAVAAALLKQHPDLVALQEVDVNTNRSGKINEAALLAKKLDMNFYFAKALDHDGGDYGVAILSRFPISEGKTYLLPKNNDAKAEQRVMATVKVRLEDGREIRFASTHFDAQKSNENRMLQTNAIIEICKKERLPFIIGGDLNATPDAASIKIFDTQFTRTCQHCDFTIPVGNPDKTIDYIAYKTGNPFTVVSHSAIAEKYASDHLPILAVLRF